MAGEIGHGDALTRGWRHEHVVCRHDVFHLATEERACALRADVLDRRNEPRDAKLVGAVVGTLPGEIVHFSCANHVVEGGARFRVQDGVHRARREIGQRQWLEPRPRASQHVERRGEHRLLCRPAAALFFAALGGRSRELVLDDPDSQRRKRRVGIPDEGQIGDRVVAAVSGLVGGLRTAAAPATGVEAPAAGGWPAVWGPGGAEPPPPGPQADSAAGVRGGDD